MTAGEQLHRPSDPLPEDEPPVAERPPVGNDGGLFLVGAPGIGLARQVTFNPR